MFGYKPETTAGPREVRRCATWAANVADAVERDKAGKVLHVDLLGGGAGRIDGTRRLSWSNTGTALPVTGRGGHNPERPFMRSPIRRSTPRSGTSTASRSSASNPLACRATREVALPSDPLVAAVQAAQAAGDDRVRELDVSEFFCDESYCHGAVGGLPIYFDPDHLNKQLSVRLAPHIDARLENPAQG